MTLPTLSRAEGAARLSGPSCLGAVLAAGLLCAACSPVGDLGVDGEGSLRGQELADAALAAFGHDNPSCRMWTDWQSLCSRTGPGMETYCKKDPGFPVAASEPFCANWQLPDDTTRLTWEFDTPAQRRSRNRFCEVFAGDEGADREQLGDRPECALYAAKRPFDGRRTEAIAHPLCRQWRQMTPETAVVLGPAACTSWVEPLPCPWVIGHAYRFPDPSTIVMPTVRNVRREPVWGVHCIEATASAPSNAPNEENAA
jgi:hypothetical protein